MSKVDLKISVEESDVFDNFLVSDFINHFGESSIVSEIGVAGVLSELNIKEVVDYYEYEILEQFDTRSIIDYLRSKGNCI